MSLAPHRRLRRRLPLAMAVASAALMSAAGCSTRNDVAFNPYAPANGDPTLMERAQQAVDTVGEALDNLGARLENTVH